jgi:hypothetical protein
MATLTADQLADMQGDLGIGSTGDVFTDKELSRLYTRAGSDYDLTVVYALDQLLVDAAKLNDYTAGASSEKKSQVFNQLKMMRAMWGVRAGVGQGTLRAGVVDLDFQDKGD